MPQISEAYLAAALSLEKGLEAAMSRIAELAVPAPDLESSRACERSILSGENLTVKGVFERAAEHLSLRGAYS